MLCPSISVNLFEQEAYDEKCPCNMDDCKCLHKSARKESTKSTIETVPLDKKYNPARRALNKYNPPHVCITIDQTCTDKSLASLFANGVRLVHIQLASGTREQVDRLILKVCTVIAGHYIKHPSALSIALALEIAGRVPRTGRLHNDQPVQLIAGNRVFVTSNSEYKNCSTKDAIFVSNLETYFCRLQVGEFIFINKSKIQLIIVKVTQPQHILTCCVLRGSQLDSNMEVILPYLLDQEASLTPEEIRDCEYAAQNQADFVVVPIVSNAEYLKSVRELCNGSLNANVFILSEIEPSCFDSDRSDNVDAIIDVADGLWWSKASARISGHGSRAICKAKQTCKPVVLSFWGLRPAVSYYKNKNKTYLE